MSNDAIRGFSRISTHTIGVLAILLYKQFTTIKGLVASIQALLQALFFSLLHVPEDVNASVGIIANI